MVAAANPTTIAQRRVDDTSATPTAARIANPPSRRTCRTRYGGDIDRPLSSDRCRGHLRETSRHAQPEGRIAGQQPVVQEHDRQGQERGREPPCRAGRRGAVARSSAKLPDEQGGGGRADEHECSTRASAASARARAARAYRGRGTERASPATTHPSIAQADAVSARHVEEQRGGTQQCDGREGRGTHAGEAPREDRRQRDGGGVGPDRGPHDQAPVAPDRVKAPEHDRHEGLRRRSDPRLEVAPTRQAIEEEDGRRPIEVDGTGGERPDHVEGDTDGRHERRREREQRRRGLLPVEHRPECRTRPADLSARRWLAPPVRRSLPGRPSPAAGSGWRCRRGRGRPCRCRRSGPWAPG